MQKYIVRAEHKQTGEHIEFIVMAESADQATGKIGIFGHESDYCWTGTTGYGNSDGDSNMAAKDGFSAQVIAQGSYIDNGTGDGKVYLVKIYNVRLNHVALNKWIMSKSFSSREFYETDQEWLDHTAKYQAYRKAFDEQLVEALGINGSRGGISVAQIQSEVFTVVHIHEVKQ